MENKVKHFFENICDFLSNAWSYLVMLFTLMLTNDTAVLHSFLFSMLFLDYVTGIMASYVESDGKHKVYFIESKRLRESGVKIVGYMLLIICSWFITVYIYPQDIKLFGVLKEFNVLQLTLIMAISIEFFSNLENAKRMGFDVVEKIKNGSKKVWEIINSIKGR